MPAPVDAPKKSIGHIAFDIKKGYEFFAGQRFVWRASISSPIECTGRREIGYIQCTIETWNDSDLSVKYGMAEPISNDDVARMAELKRLQRFQASGSDAPAPVCQYERGD